MVNQTTTKLEELFRYLDEQVYEHIEAQQVQLLLLIYRKKVVPQGEICNYISMSNSSVSRNIHKLSKWYDKNKEKVRGAGLMTTEQDVFNPRAFNVSLTDRGRKAIENMKRIIGE